MFRHWQSTIPPPRPLLKSLVDEPFFSHFPFPPLPGAGDPLCCTTQHAGGSLGPAVGTGGGGVGATQASFPFRHPSLLCQGPDVCSSNGFCWYDSSGLWSFHSAREEWVESEWEELFSKISHLLQRCRPAKWGLISGLFWELFLVYLFGEMIFGNSAHTISSKTGGKKIADGNDPKQISSPQLNCPPGTLQQMTKNDKKRQQGRYCLLGVSMTFESENPNPVDAAQKGASPRGPSISAWGPCTAAVSRPSSPPRGSATCCASSPVCPSPITPVSAHLPLGCSLLMPSILSSCPSLPKLAERRLFPHKQTLMLILKRITVDMDVNMDMDNFGLLRITTDMTVNSGGIGYGVSHG